MEIFDVVVVGAGQAGLGISYFLQRDGRNHVVLESGRIGESWLSQRWDSFKLNTINFMNVLPGLPYKGSEPHGFWRRDELTGYFNQYVKHFQLPVCSGMTVTSVEKAKNEEHYVIKTLTDQQVKETLLSRTVVIASGILRKPKIPSLQSRLPNDMTQLHSAGYHNPQALPPGAIVIAGSGQTGCQIAEDLLSDGRTVYLCTSKVGRAPRRYRGRDILEWWIETGFLDVTYASLKDKAISRIPQPQISVRGRRGRTLSLQQLARQGVVILGHLADIDSGTLAFGDDAAANVHFADAFSQHLKDDVDGFLARMGFTQPPLEDDPADLPDPRAECVSLLLSLNLKQANISTVIWATGFTGDFGYIHLPVIDPQGMPIHERGVSLVSGLYFLGFPWLSSRKSGLIYGIEDDARFIANAITEHLD